VFSEWRRTLKPKAPFLVSIPYEQAYYDLTHTNFFNESSLVELFSKYNFKVLECYRDTRLNNDCLNLLCLNDKENNEIKLSILVCSLVERSSNFLSPLLESLGKQIKDLPVEIIVFSDNAKRPIGKKRNDCLLLSQGEYVCFVDDDDRVSGDYVSSILDSINKNPDVIVFDAEISFNGENRKRVKYGKEFNYCELNDIYYRHPNHLMVHKKNNILEKYKEVKTGEDDEWALRMLSHIKTQERIDKTLYYYDYNTETKKYFE
jgi:glycosyltransferase involved in cell wall biosynthesis